VNHNVITTQEHQAAKTHEHKQKHHFKVWNNSPTIQLKAYKHRLAQFPVWPQQLKDMNQVVVGEMSGENDG